MSAYQKCKGAGLSGLVELSELSSVPIRTLQNWHNKKPVLFDVIVSGSALKKASIC